MKNLAIDPTNGACGAIFVATGAFFAIQSLGLDLGTTFRMGPGYFPLVLGVILAGLGILITLQSFGSKPQPGGEIGHFGWRPLIFIIGANLIFGLLLGGLPSMGIPAMGLIVAIIGLTFVSMLASKDFCIKRAIMLSAQASLQRIIEAALDRFPILRQKADAQASTLSGGQQKQLEIAHGTEAGPALDHLASPEIRQCIPHRTEEAPHADCLKRLRL